MRFENIRGTTNDSTSATRSSLTLETLLITFIVINLACSQAVGCSDLVFKNFNVRNPEGADEYICENAHHISGLKGEFS